MFDLNTFFVILYYIILYYIILYYIILYYIILYYIPKNFVRRAYDTTLAPPSNIIYFNSQDEIWM